MWTQNYPKITSQARFSGTKSFGRLIHQKLTPRSTLSNGADVIIYSHSQCQYAHHNRPRVYIANLSSHLPLPNAKQISNPAVKPPPSRPGKINSAGKTT